MGLSSGVWSVLLCCWYSAPDWDDAATGENENEDEVEVEVEAGDTQLFGLEVRVVLEMVSVLDVRGSDLDSRIFLYFILLFWNHILSCRSERLSSADNSERRGRQR